jgi:hypothetical protein
MVSAARYSPPSAAGVLVSEFDGRLAVLNPHLHDGVLACRNGQRRHPDHRRQLPLD